MKFLSLCLFVVSLVLAGCDQTEPEDSVEVMVEVVEAADAVSADTSVEPAERVWEGIILVQWADDPRVAPDVNVEFVDGSVAELEAVENGESWKFEMPYHICAKTQVMWLEPQADTERLRATYINRESGNSFVGLDPDNGDIEPYAHKMKDGQKIHMFILGFTFSSLCIS